jgi:hypothetical protein
MTHETIKKKKMQKKERTYLFSNKKKKKKTERKEGVYLLSNKRKKKKKKNHKEKKITEKKIKCREGNLFSLLHLG